MEINNEDVKYPVGIQNFESLLRDDYVYVDKTALIYQLAKTGKYYFLSRPRRFGKSLLISTLDAYFSGMKDLFKGLAMESLETKWTVYPVLHLDLNTGKYDEQGKLDEVLDNYLAYWESLYGTSSSEYSLEIRFKEIIKRACEKTGQQVVVLVDEYDKPLLQTITNNDLQTEYRNTLKAFYSVLKTHDKYIKFAFITGVTKFSKISIFSDLNNLADISMDEKYQTICGITEAEIHEYFEESLNEV
ncbi:MAG: AAA family ATPase, partial [Bacteroidales bacterium]|nr:AAA family ATPase [Bacteroidales bacterium]